MLIGQTFSTPTYAPGGAGGTSPAPSAAPSATGKPAATAEWSRTAPQSPVMRESIHQMMSLMKDPEVSGLIATMKADEDASVAGFDAVVRAYEDNA